MYICPSDNIYNKLHYQILQIQKMNLSTTTVGNKIKYKIVLLGDKNVGKSCIIERFVNNRFDKDSNPTVGIDFIAKNLTYKNKTFRLQLWDTAGQERFRSLIPHYLKDVICALIVYDVTNKESLINADKWLKLFNDNNNMDGYSVLVGNKIDCEQRIIPKEEGKNVGVGLGLKHYEISAKEGTNVEDLFFEIIDYLSEDKTHAEEIKKQIKQPVGNNQDKKQEELTQKEFDVTLKNIKKDEKQQEKNDVTAKKIVLNSNDTKQPIQDIKPHKKKCC